MGLKHPCLILWIVLLSFCAVSAEDRPYTVELLNFYPSSEYDKSWVDWDTLQLKQKKRNIYTVTGDFILQQNVGDQQKLVVQVFPYDVERKTRGPLFFEINSPFCKFVQEDDKTYPGMTEKSNLPKNPECPFPKATYTFDNYELETTFLPDNTPHGDYVIDVYLKDNEFNVAAYVCEITVKDP